MMTNSVLISDENRNCVAIDAWGIAADWIKLLEDRQLNLIAIYATHGHGDHISAAPELAEKYNVPWYLHKNDLPILIGTNWILNHFGLPDMPDDYKPSTDMSLGDVQILPGLNAEIIEMPGHSPGGIAMYFKDKNILIIGDSIFQDCIGRYDLPGSNYDDLMKSVSKIYNMNLSDDTVVIHGHGENTNVGFLKSNNRYFKS